MRSQGQSIYAYVTLNTGVEKSDALKKELVAHVRNIIGPIATAERRSSGPTALPKTRSGKIMRRILKKVAANDIGDLGDTSTLGRSLGRDRPGQESGFNILSLFAFLR